MYTIEMPVKEVWEGNHHDYTDVARQGHFHIRARASLVTKWGLLPKMATQEEWCTFMANGSWKLSNSNWLYHRTTN